MKRKRRALGRKNKRMGMLLCVPAMVIVAFALYTLLYALVMSFNTNMGVVQGHFEFAGFDNYIETSGTRYCMLLLQFWSNLELVSLYPPL